jgi:hypothetical protein
MRARHLPSMQCQENAKKKAANVVAIPTPISTD